MKKIKQKTKRKIVLAVCVLAAALVIVLIVQGVRGLFYKKADTSAGLEYIHGEEKGDIAAIEKKIELLEKKDGEEGTGERSLKEKFTGAVIVGDSITEGFTEYDILNTSSVVAKIGVHLDELDEQIKQVKKLSPGIIFLSLGMNDVEHTNGDADEFVKQYGAVVDELKKSVPGAHIFVNAIFPVQEKAVKEKPVFAEIENFNEKLKELCDKKRIAFIDSSDLMSDEYYEQDGIHFKASFYPVWRWQAYESVEENNYPGDALCDIASDRRIRCTSFDLYKRQQSPF